MAINMTGLPAVNAGTHSKASGSSVSARDGMSEKQAATVQTQPETVTLSSEAQMLSKLEEQVGKLPDANEGRVANIKQAIQDGTFSINPERIAAKLASLEDKLFS